MEDLNTSNQNILSTDTKTVKSTKPLIVGLSALAGIATICAATFGILYFSNNQSEENSSSTSKVDSFKQSETPTAPVYIPDTTAADGTTDETSGEPENILLRPIMIGASDALNNDSRFAYTTSTAVQTAFGYETIKNNGYTARIEICEDALKKYYQYSTGKGCEFFDIEFDTPIADLFLGGFGQSPGYEVFFFLMSDGTVEYMPLYEAVKSGNIRSYGKLDGISDVVKITSSSVGCKGEQSCGGWITTIGIRSDGSFYDFQPALKDEDLGWWN